MLLGRCVDLGTGALPYQPFSEAFSQLAREGGPAREDGAARESPGPHDVTARAAAILQRVAGERPALARIAGAGRVPADRTPGDTGMDRLALFEAVAHLLGRIGDEVAPLLLVVEDLHWADASTRDLVRFLLARLGSDRLLVLLSYRGDDLHRRHPLRPLVGELLRLTHVQRLDLAPFADDELALFLTAVARAGGPGSEAGGPGSEEGGPGWEAGGPGRELIRRIAARSAGNAYYAEELLAAGTGDDLPAGLADVLLDRVERLSAQGQHAIRVASVLGSARIDDGLLRACLVADRATDVHAALREAQAHQVLVPDGDDRWAFRHALLQEAVHADLLPGERVRLHATAAHELTRRAQADPGSAGGLAADQARHALAAHDLPLALAASLQAARDAGRRSAPAEALAHYDQALQLFDAVGAARRPPGEDPVTIGIAAATAAGDAGLHERAVALSRAAFDATATGVEGDPVAMAGAGTDVPAGLPAGVPAGVRRARAGAALAQHVYEIDDGLAARELARQVVAGLAGHGPDPARVLARAIEVRVDVSIGDPHAALAVVPSALAEAEELGLSGLRADLLTTMATANGMAGLPGTGERWVQARAAAEQAGDEAAMIRVLYNIGVDRVDQADLAGATAALTEAIALADRAGLSSAIFGAQARSLLIELRWQLGDAEGAIAVAGSTGQMSGPLVRQLRLVSLPLLAVRDPERVLSGGDLVAPGDQWFYHQVQATARAEALGWVGRREESVETARSALHFVDADPEPYRLVGISISTAAVGVLADAAAAARTRGDDEGAARAVTAARSFVDDARARAEHGRPRRFTMGPEGLAWLARLDLEVARLTGDDDAAGWERVTQAFTGVSLYQATLARWRRAEALIRAGEREAAREPLATARAAATRLGAATLVTALDDLARRARLEVAPAEPADAVLTRRERDVMALVAEGLTNRAIGERLFISEKTASVHISNVLAKLGASGRTQAVALIGRHGLLDPRPG